MKLSQDGCGCQRVYECSLDVRNAFGALFRKTNVNVDTLPIYEMPAESILVAELLRIHSIIGLSIEYFSVTILSYEMPSESVIV